MLLNIDISLEYKILSILGVVKKGGDMSKTNVCVFGLTKHFVDNVCQELANKLDMFYANINKLFKYELTDLDKVEQICGVEFLLKEEISIIRRTCTYDNTLICMEYPLLNNGEILNIVKDNCLLIYLGTTQERFDKEMDRFELSPSIKVIEKDAFEDRDYLCRNMADLVVDYEDFEMDLLINRIIEKIVEYYS